MAMALTKVVVHGVEPDEPLFKRYRQFVYLTITGANTDIDYDFGDSAGTFWTAVGATEPGLTAQKAIADIQIRARAFLSASGAALQTRALIDASQAVAQTLDSAASAGGAATENLTVTGLQTTDLVQSVTQFQKGANGTALIDYGDASGQASALNTLPAEWTADPGAGAKVRVLFTRVSTTPAAGTYILSMGAQYTKVPNILFAAGDAPTAFEVCLIWELNDDEAPVEAVKAA